MADVVPLSPRLQGGSAGSSGRPKRSGSTKSRRAREAKAALQPEDLPGDQQDKQPGGKSSSVCRHVVSPATYIGGVYLYTSVHPLHIMYNIIKLLEVYTNNHVISPSHLQYNNKVLGRFLSTLKSKPVSEVMTVLKMTQRGENSG